MALEDGFASILRTRFAIILTEHSYSREKNYHLVVPILRGPRAFIDPSVVRVANGEWLHLLGEGIETVLIPVQVIQSAWYADDFMAETPYVLDEDTLDRIDLVLVSMFGLTHG